MNEAPRPGNIMSEPIPTGNSPTADQANRQKLDEAVARLDHAKEEAVAAARDIVKLRPITAVAIAAGGGLLFGLLCRKRG